MCSDSITVPPASRDRTGSLYRLPDGCGFQYEDSDLTPLSPPPSGMALTVVVPIQRSKGQR